MNMDINDLRSLVTLVSFGIFGVIAAWAWLPRNRGRFEEDALLVFEGEPAGEQGRAQ